MKALATAALALITAGATQAQDMNCMPRQAFVTGVGSQFGESRQSIGMASRGVIAEMWANAETGTWTITITSTDGMTCLVLHGDDFEALDESPHGATF